MAREFKLEVLTPDRVFYRGMTEMVVLQSVEGEMAVMYDHEPIVLPLAIGALKVKNHDGGFSVAAGSKGLLTVKDTVCTVLTESAEWVDEIDLERALRAKKRAEERLNAPEPTSKGYDLVRAKLALQKALNRIKIHSMK